LSGGDWGFASGLVNPVDPHRPGNVLDLLLAHVVEDEIELVAHLVAHEPG